MDYEKAYNEAIERAKQFMSEHPTRAEADLMVALFPELKESEEERIRKELVALFIEVRNREGNEGYWHDLKVADILAYLEKQKELPFVKDVVLGYPGLYFYDGERMHFRGSPAMEEKQKEQPIELCDGACCDDDRFKIIAEAKKDIVEKTNITENELSMELPLLDGILMRVWQVGWLNKKPAELQKEQKFTPDWMPKFLDKLRSMKHYFDWDEHRDIEGHILAIINWIAPNYFNKKQKEQNH